MTRLLLSTLLVVAGIAAVEAAPPAEQRSGGRLVLPTAPGQKKSEATVLVRVNGEAITAPDLRWAFEMQKVPALEQQSRQREVLERLVDQRLLQQFLRSRAIKASPEEVADRVERIKIAAGVAPPAEDKSKARPESLNPLAANRFDEERVRGEVSFALAWQKYLEVAIGPQTVRDYFAKHKPEFDGTELRASHIVLLVPTNRESDELHEVEAQLKQLRTEIVQKKITFADAARMHSQGPSREQGGDVGFFPFRGKMPTAFCDVAFRLKEGEISQPFRSPFGVHLCVVTGRKPGELSLEDARPAVLRVLSQEIRQQRIAELRAKAKIEWIPGKDQIPAPKP